MSTLIVKHEDEFSLDIIAAVLANYRVPAGKPGTGGKWKRVYSHYSMVDPRTTTPGGSVTLAHKPGNVSELAVAYERKLAQGAQYTETTGIRFEWSGKLCIPTAWEIESSVVSHGKAPDGISGKKSARIRDNTLSMKTPDGVHDYAAPAPSTINWLLFDAVPRFEGKRIEPVRFTLIDHGDKVKPGITLSYRKSVKVLIGKTELELQTYEMKGRGILPTVFWMDERGLLLFVVSGMEAYCLKEVS